MRCLVCNLCQNKDQYHLKVGINRILLRFNQEKFHYRNPATGDTPRMRVTAEEWIQCTTDIKEFLKEHDIWVTIIEIHNHATRCNIYPRVFISPEIPPVNLQTKVFEPWSTGAIIYF